MTIPETPVARDESSLRNEFSARDQSWCLEAISVLDPRPVLATLAQATGDRGLLRTDLCLSSDENEDSRRRDRGRELAVEALLRWSSGVVLQGEDPITDLEVIQFLSGKPDSASAGFLLAQQHELVDAERADGLHIGIIGAGLSGIAAAVKLRAAGHTVQILERNKGFGGTWLLNDYPGCRLDTGSFTYSYSFAHRRQWPEFYSSQGEVLEYLTDVAEEYGLADSTTFGVEVTSAIWDDRRRVWRVNVTDEAGTKESVFDALVSAVGQLGVPSIPKLSGIEGYTGEIVHSNRWRHDLNYSGKRVGVIGTGATGVQIAPELAEDSKSLVVFQRSAPWLVPTPEYRRSVPISTRELFDELRGLTDWYRFWQFWSSVEGRLPLSKIDDRWNSPGSISAPNLELRESLADYLRTELSEQPDLLEKALPKYAPGSKRMVRDDGTWTRMLKRENVHLETEGIEEFTPTGVRVSTGEEIQLDIVVFASGFAAADFLSGIEVRGIDGISLHDYWDGESRGYMGSLVPGFPNFFMVYGPNTNLVVNGSIMFMSECAVDYIRACLSLLDGSGATLEVKKEAYDSFISEMNDSNDRRAWGQGSVTNWYKNATGVVTQVWPHSLIEFWQRTRKPELSHLVVKPVSTSK